MEQKLLEQLIEESIRIELNISALYAIFSNQHEIDNDFWWQLHLEEHSHATLLRTAKDSFARKGLFPKEIIALSLPTLSRANERIAEITEQCRNTPVSRIEAIEIAISLEQEAGESHYSQFMEKDANNSVESVFQQLNREDKNHEQRLKDHLKMIRQEA